MHQILVNISLFSLLAFVICHQRNIHSSIFTLILTKEFGCEETGVGGVNQSKNNIQKFIETEFTTFKMFAIEELLMLSSFWKLQMKKRYLKAFEEDSSLIEAFS